MEFKSKSFSVEGGNDLAGYIDSHFEVDKDFAGTSGFTVTQVDKFADGCPIVTPVKTFATFDKARDFANSEVAA